MEEKTNNYYLLTYKNFIINKSKRIWFHIRKFVSLHCD